MKKKPREFFINITIYNGLKYFSITKNIDDAKEYANTYGGKIIHVREVVKNKKAKVKK